MSRPDSFDPLLHKLGIDSIPFRDELGVRNDLIAVLLILEGGVFVEYDEVDLSSLKERVVSGSILPIFSHDDFGLGVLGDVLAGLRVVGGVDADGDAPGEEAAVEGKEPLGCIEPDDIDSGELGELVGDECLGEFEGLVVVFPEIDGVLPYCRVTQWPSCLWDSAGRSPNLPTTTLNYSIRVDGIMAEVPSLPMRIGISALKSSVQRMSLCGYCASLGVESSFCSPSGEMK